MIKPLGSSSNNKSMKNSKNGKKYYSNIIQNTKYKYYSKYSTLFPQIKENKSPHWKDKE